MLTFCLPRILRRSRITCVLSEAAALRRDLVYAAASRSVALKRDATLARSAVEMPRRIRNQWGDYGVRVGARLKAIKHIPSPLPIAVRRQLINHPQVVDAAVVGIAVQLPIGAKNRSPEGPSPPLPPGKL